MMKKNLTEIVFILDRSGSMSGLESDTIGASQIAPDRAKACIVNDQCVCCGTCAGLRDRCTKLTWV